MVMSSLDGERLAWTILPQLGISLLEWIQIILSLNMFRSALRFSRYELVALALYLIAAFVRVVAGAATVVQNLALQITAGIVASLLTYSGFVIIFNQSWALPSRQQLGGGIFVLVPTVLWEVHTRLFLDMK